MNINLIAAIGKNNELGKNGNLIWNIKEDMKFFKNTTMGHPIVMGRKTFESLPKVLPGRKNIVMSSKKIINEQIEIYKKEGRINDKEKEICLKLKNLLTAFIIIIKLSFIL